MKLEKENSVTVEIDEGNIDLIRNVLSIAFSGNHEISMSLGIKGFYINKIKEVEILDLYENSLNYRYEACSNVFNVNFNQIKEITIHNREFLNPML